VRAIEGRVDRRGARIHDRDRLGDMARTILIIVLVADVRVDFEGGWEISFPYWVLRCGTSAASSRSEIIALRHFGRSGICRPDRNTVGLNGVPIPIGTGVVNCVHFRFVVMIGVENGWEDARVDRFGG